MTRTRVLIVDDAVVVRRVLSTVISEDPDLEVVGTAANGRLALDQLELLRPEIVVLDVEMPEMDGLATLVEIRKRQPRLPVIMFSTLTQRGATATLDALSRGANDYLTKPTATAGMAEAKDQIRRDLVPRIRALVGRERHDQIVVGPSPLRAPTGGGAEGAVDVVAIGVSTGGPNALSDLLPRLPADLRVPVILVQHMPPVFTRLLAERLNHKCALTVIEAEDGMAVLRGRVYVAPGDHHLEVTKATIPVIRVTQGAPENSCRPSVDVLFRSVARVYGARSLALVLTGMGYDGVRGSEEIVRAGGRVLVQDKETSVVWGMPGYVAKANLADRVLPLHEIVPEVLQRLSRSGNSRRGPAQV
jgi:two-component system chemotaxis response regulator CheB